MISNNPVTLINKPSNFKFVTTGEGLVIQQASAPRRMTGFKAGKGIATIKPHHLAYRKSKHAETSLNILHAHSVHSREKNLDLGIHKFLL